MRPGGSLAGVETIVEGAIVDVDGVAPGYVRIREGRVVERGAVGADSSHGRVRRIKGIALPSAVNSHTHLGDVGFGREPPVGSVESVIAAPDGVKFRYLAGIRPRPHRAALRRALLRMITEGTGAFVDFREQGLEGVRRLRAASAGLPVTARILGRPLQRPVVAEEMAALLAEADGIGISSAREEPPEVRTTIASACHAAGKTYALHASEVVREAPEEYLHPRPDLLVHLTCALDEDLVAVREANVPVAVCPRSNALYGRLPDLGRLERLGLKMLLGTDNGLLNAPSIWRELEFAYVSQRLTGHPVTPQFLVRSVFLEPWAWLGMPEAARLQPGSPARPLAVRLPPEDPEYQLVTRTSERVIVLPGDGGTS
jgi:cytosine/adenosine deaminase-related metal-dependent hydrolase